MKTSGFRSTKYMIIHITTITIEVRYNLNKLKLRPPGAEAGRPGEPHKDGFMICPCGHFCFKFFFLLNMHPPLFIYFFKKKLIVFPSNS